MDNAGKTVIEKTAVVANPVVVSVTIAVTGYVPGGAFEATVPLSTPLAFIVTPGGAPLTDQL
jgi:hypothetical protein